MATVLIEEVVMGLDDVKGSLEQAMTTLEAILEDLHADLGVSLPTTLDRELLRPLQSRLAFVERLQETLSHTQ
jgi:hypothetical protein